MGKFKVGDRVRRVTGMRIDGMEIGDAGIVSAAFDRWIGIEEFPAGNGDNTPFLSSNFELVEPQWQPKVGDRVRLVRDSRNANGETIAALKKDKVVTIEGVTGGLEKYQKDGWTAYSTDTIFWVRSDDIEPLPVAAPAALTIEAGKFYKTRDGRKVGPVQWDVGVDGWIVKLGDGSAWYRNGKVRELAEIRSDLIAEWVDEPAIKAKYVGEQPAPTATTTASNDNAAPAKFKVGDVVELTSDGYAADVGATAHVRKVRADGMFDIEWVRNSLRNGQRDGGYYLSSPAFKLAVAKNTAIVALIEDGIAKPATRPYVHATAEVATAEAERLASIHRGKQFGIYVLADTCEADKPAYEHEWKNLAASGEKIQAIKALRGLTGMGLKPAKDAVEYFLAAV